MSVLLSSVGVALSETICRMADTALPPTAKEHACCSTSGKTTDQDGCCEQNVSYEKLETVAVQKQHNLVVPVYFFSVTKPLLPQFLANIGAEARIYSYTDSSPPLYGRNLLHRYHVLIV
ncbi:hypothetical protein ACFQ2O_03930 [Pontibacter rugosus]|uniref:Uncharacterized protein n=1 Tax=Pontibacter rugosus TaxID=1745966 RepID=A0ABW3SP94_9BACT